MWPAARPGAANPYTTLLTRALERRGVGVEECSWPAAVRGRYDVVHVHWPEWTLGGDSFAGKVRLLAACRLARRRGARLVWTVHNLGAHDRDTRGGAWPWTAFCRMVDAAVSLTAGAVPEIRAAFPRLDAPITVVPHGHYRDVYELVDRAAARRDLGLDPVARVLLAFGHVRRYKGVDRLLRTFRTLPGDAVLVVAGEPADPTLRREIEAAAALDPRVRLHLARVAPEEVSRWFAAADLVVAPYTEMLNSGVALLALSLDRPVLGPRRGAFAELRDDLGDTWVRTFVEPLDGDQLERALDAPAPEGSPDLSACDWDAVAAATVEVYRAARGAHA